MTFPVHVPAPSGSRHDYRFAFAGDACPTAEIWMLSHRRVTTARVLNLSLGGMCIEVPRPGPTMPVHGWLQACLTLDGQRIDVFCQVVHIHISETSVRYGVRFLRLPDAQQNKMREHALWTFLLQQRPAHLQERPNQPREERSTDTVVIQQSRLATTA